MIVEGELDINTPGTYRLSYTVTNSFSNRASVERTVIVKGKILTPTPITPSLPQTGQNLIALAGIIATVSGIGTVIIFYISFNFTSISGG